MVIGKRWRLDRASLIERRASGLGGRQIGEGRLRCAARIVAIVAGPAKVLAGARIQLFPIVPTHIGYIQRIRIWMKSKSKWIA